jgi:glucokinase
MRRSPDGERFMTELVAVDVGGTHARFALASVENGTIALDEPVTLETADHPGLESAWRAFERIAGTTLPRAAAVAIAGPVTGDVVPMTNSPWVLHISQFRGDLDLGDVTVLNDFGAVAHAVARAPASQLVNICGPDRPLPEHGTVSVIGPGTGLGVAHFHRFPDGYHVQATEGGHIGFAPQDEFDDRLLANLRQLYGRVATERVNAGPGIALIYAALGGQALTHDRVIWERGLSGEDALAEEAVERFCTSLGATAGDYALAHGASAVVLAGGLGLRLREILPHSDFGKRFCAKPRYEAMMANIPVKLIVHPQPGLFGAAAAFAAEHGS